MNILSIDTSTKNFSMAVLRDGQCLIYRNKKCGKLLSSSIMPNIEQVLTKSGLSLSDIDGFSIGLGPGSFTSLRVGLATVKALSFALNKPIVGVSSLDVVAYALEGDHKQICVVSDAKRNKVYTAFYQKNGGVLKRKKKYTLTEIDDLPQTIRGECMFIGDGIPLCKGQIKKAGLIEPLFREEEKLWRPQARYAAELALTRFADRQYDDPNKIVPLYLYPENCQVRR